MLSVKVTGLGELKRIIGSLEAMQKRANMAQLHAEAGHWAQSEMRRNFNENAWDSPKDFPRGFRAGAARLMDQRKLYRSISYESDATRAIAGTADPAAAIHEGTGMVTLRGSKGYLALPLSPPLTPAEAHAYNNANVPGGFVLGLKNFSRKRTNKKRVTTWNELTQTGYEGPGVYRKRRGVIERVKAFVRAVKIRRTPFALDVSMSVSDLVMRWLDIIVGDVKASKRSASNGNPIVRRG